MITNHTHYFYYFYESIKFCCFVWLQLSCEIVEASKCHQQYAALLERQTVLSFGSACDPPSFGRSSFLCRLTPQTIVTLLTVATILTVILTVSCAIYAFYSLKVSHFEESDQKKITPATLKTKEKPLKLSGQSK